MRVLIAHVGYRQRGGEDAVVEHQREILVRTGHEVGLLLPESRQFDAMPLRSRVAMGLNYGGHQHGIRTIREAIGRFEPDVVHVHNVHPLLGPGAIRAVRESGCAVVRTLHNYRISCVAGTHFLAGAVCELCSPGRHGPGVARGCYRGSILQSYVLSKGEGEIWSQTLGQGGAHLTIALTDFMRDYLVRYGADASLIRVHPNCVARGPRIPRMEKIGVALVGRLSEEKGVLPLVESWSSGGRLSVIGSGPMERGVRTAVRGSSHCEYLGQLSQGESRERVAKARALAFPSIWYEGLPLTLLEALAAGTPPVAFDLGAMRLLRDVDERLLVEPGRFDLMRERLEWVHDLPDKEWTALSDACVAHFEANYTHERNVKRLVEIYEQALAMR